MKRLAVIFPGIGYHADKPLLYYSKKIAVQYGFSVAEVPYGNFPEGVKGSSEKMKQAFSSALEQSEEILKDIDFTLYDCILFLSKSIGTAVAAAFGERHGLRTNNVFYTPVMESLDFMKDDGIIFHGTSDPWAETEPFVRGCKEKGYPVYLVEKGNHSLETGDVLLDIENMGFVMKKTDEYIKKILL